MSLLKIINVQKLHIKNQVENGASIIQVFDSWAGLLGKESLKNIYKPTAEIVSYTKSLGQSNLFSQVHKILQRIL